VVRVSHNMRIYVTPPTTTCSGDAHGRRLPTDHVGTGTSI
jgi:hypothetical protein